jgi:hypothetical protein
MKTAELGWRLTIGLLAFVVAPSVAKAQSIPLALAVPEGHEAFLSAAAEGTQNYICLPSANGTLSWRFLGPQATLFRGENGQAGQQITTHFLSANPAEGAVARPTWQHSRDSSRVWGRVIASSSDPNYVEPGAIPWLLLEVAGTANGTTGAPSLTRTTYIQRLHTSGGIAPATGCSQPAEIGTLALVPYTTDYVFFRPTGRK